MSDKQHYIPVSARKRKSARSKSEEGGAENKTIKRNIMFFLR
jgi:hypothetical protein